MWRSGRAAAARRRSTTRASTAMAPVSSAISGLMSSSAICGQLAHHLRDAQQHRLERLAVAPAGMLRNSPEQLRHARAADHVADQELR